MGKHGPCRHCGVTSTPLWRNGPPEKPVLCNACGSRWRTKGSLAHYTPLHAREQIEFEEPKAAKMRTISFKHKEHKFLKRKQVNGIVENDCGVPFSESDPNYSRTIECNGSNRSSSGSAISYSESCANFKAADMSDWTGSSQSNSRDSSLVPVPSKKRSVIQPKPSPFEKLTKDLYCIWHEQQSSNISGSSEEDLLFEGETPMGSVEIGHGGVLLRYPCHKTIEEESEASSLPVEKTLTSDAYSRSTPFAIDSESKRSSPSKASVDKVKISTVQVSHVKRGSFSSENLSMLEDRDSLLRFNNLKDPVSLEVYMMHMANDEQQQLLKYLPYIDTAKPFESLRSLFSSPLFMENLPYFQQLLQDGIFDFYFSQMTFEENGILKLMLLKSTNSKRVDHCRKLKDIDHRQGPGVRGGENFSNFQIARDIQNEQMQDLKRTMRSPKIVYRSNSIKCPTKSSTLNPVPTEANKVLDAEDFMDNEGTCFSPRSLFTWPPDRSSELQFTDDNSDQDLLLDVRCNVSFPEAELLHHNHPWNEKTASICVIAAEEDSLCNFPASSFSNQQLKQHK